MSALLLDTCAAIWLSAREPMADEAIRAIDQAAAANALWVSPITAWETALKIQSGRPDAPRVSVSAAHWYRSLVSLPGVREARLDGATALRSVDLPPLHRDPADRFLIATAIELGAALVTRDARIIDYANAGVVQVLSC